jgi:muconolactone delta-isomerase
MKFLVIWKLELSLLSAHVAAAVARMPAYAQPLEKSGQVAARYHIVGAHGGAWIYDVGSNEELERLIAMMPIYNFAHYTVYPLADMPDWDEVPAPAPADPAPAPADAAPGLLPLQRLLSTRLPRQRLPLHRPVPPLRASAPHSPSALSAPWCPCAPGALP